MISPLIEGDSLILASGFFQEDPEKDYSILDDRLLAAIRSNENITEIQAIGAMSSPAPFNEFCNKLSENWGGTLIRKRKSNWHAKIGMKLKSRLVDTDKIEKIPVCALIGSSNLTRPAYGIAGDIPPNVTSRLNFNYECDVMIFSKDWFGNSTVAPPKFFPGFDRQDYGSIYFQDLPEGCPNELDQMKMLLKELEEHMSK
jgi:hypothetical protein